MRGKRCERRVEVKGGNSEWERGGVRKSEREGG